MFEGSRSEQESAAAALATIVKEKGPIVLTQPGYYQTEKSLYNILKHAIETEPGKRGEE